MTDPLEFSLVEAAAAIRKREVSSEELTRLCLGRIAEHDRVVNAFIHAPAEAALVAARAADAVLARGAIVGPLHGVPLARKDNLARAGQRFTSGSRAFAERRGVETATCLRRLDAAGAVDLGGTNMSEFAFHVHGCNSLNGPPRNPWDTARIAGGSSGGSAAALAAHMVFGALGTDSGGSIRSPAALCGIVGLAPTQGRVSRHGMAPGSDSLDVIGPMARTAQDCALLLSAIAGADSCDEQASARPAPDYHAVLDRPLRGRRLGILREFPGVPEDAAQTLAAAAAVFGDLGAALVEVALPELDAMNALAAIVFVSEAAAHHSAVLRERWDDIHPEVRDRLLLAHALPDEAYRRALAVRSAVLRKFCAFVFAAADLVMLPSSPVAAPKYAAISRSGSTAGQGIASSNDPGRYTRGINYLGLPALALPAGFDGGGMPLGLQLVGKPFGEALLLNFGHQYQRATDWHRRRPPLLHGCPLP